MSYIGNQVTSVPFTADVFSGTGSATVFGPMIRIPATTASIAVFVGGSYKTPGIDYTLNVDYIVFTTPPALGTNNIVVHHLGNGVMATQVPVDGSVNSNKLASNLSFSLVRVLETANVYSTPVGGNVNIDIANNTLYYFNANTTANLTFNLRGSSSQIFDSVINTGQTVSLAIAVKHGTGRHTANVMIDNVLQTPYYVGNSKPIFLSLTNSELHFFSYTVFKTAANTYTVTASDTVLGTS